MRNGQYQRDHGITNSNDDECGALYSLHLRDVGAHDYKRPMDDVIIAKLGPHYIYRFRALAPG